MPYVLPEFCHFIICETLDKKFNYSKPFFVFHVFLKKPDNTKNGVRDKPWKAGTVNLNGSKDRLGSQQIFVECLLGT